MSRFYHHQNAITIFVIGQRQDQKFQQFENITFLKVHTACLKKYTRPKTINAAIKTLIVQHKPSTIELLTTLRSFQIRFKNRWSFCADLIHEQFKESGKKKRIALRGIIYEIRILKTNDETITQRVLEAADMINDQ